MEQLSVVSESDKRTLDRLAEEFGEDFLKINMSKRIGLYGADEIIISFFEEKLRDYFLRIGKKVPIVIGERDDSYNIDVGFFLHAGYFKRINKDINIPPLQA